MAHAQGAVPPPSQAPLPPGWTVINKSDCKVWNPAPQPTASVTWTGECHKNVADGRGVLQWRVGGQPTERYEGEMRNGRPHGRGVFTYADGRRYDGSFRALQREGKGTLSFPNGTRYEGEWKADKPNGRGTLTVMGGETYSGPWTAGCFADGNRKAWLNATPKECGFE